MKKMICALLVAALLTASFCLAEAAGDARAALIGRWADPYYGRASLRIVPDRWDDLEENETFDISIVWGSSASSAGVWLMTGVWNAEAGRLEYENGVMKEVTYGEQGDVSEKIIWDDAVGFFALDGDVLLWQDSREERSAEFRLQKQAAEAPTAEAFARDYFRAVANVEKGTAGSSLKMAKAACGVARFAADSDLWSASVASVRAAMSAAWESLTDDERGLFGENFFDIAAQIDEAFGDYEAVSGLFDDAGVGEDMGLLAGSEDAALSWEALLGFTMAMAGANE